MNRDQEKLLIDFLEADARAKHKGINLETVYAAVQRIGDQQLRHDHSLLELRKDFEEQAHRLDRYVRRTKAIESELEEHTAQDPLTKDWKRNSEDVTGTFAIQQLVMESQRKNSEHKWLKRKGIEWVVVGVGGLVMLVLSTGAAVLVNHFMGK